LATNGILRDKIEGLLKTLTYREREIIRLRYGLGDGYTYTLEEVGRIFKVTRERVRQIEAKAVRKLQNPVRSQCLEGFVPEFPLVDTREADNNKHHAEVSGASRSRVEQESQPAATGDPQDLFSFENEQMDNLFAGAELN
jgi:RNA polymerase primary sigma factor